MPPQAPAPTNTGQVNPMILRALLQRRAQQAAQGAPGAATAPNTLNAPSTPPPTQTPPRAMPPRPGVNPAAAVMKAAGAAQSPLLADTQSRGLAKQLISVLLKAM